MQGEWRAISVTQNGLTRHAVARGREIADYMATPSGAKNGAHMLNVGACSVFPHRVIGCRIAPK